MGCGVGVTRSGRSCEISDELRLVVWESPSLEDRVHGAKPLQEGRQHPQRSFFGHQPRSQSHEREQRHSSQGGCSSGIQKAACNMVKNADQGMRVADHDSKLPQFNRSQPREILEIFALELGSLSRKMQT